MRREAAVRLQWVKSSANDPKRLFELAGGFEWIQPN